MKVDVKWMGNMAFQAETPSGHQVMMDAPSQVGGENQGPNPLEMLLSSAGVCSGIEIVMTLKKMHLHVDAYSMEVSGEQTENHPRRFTKVHLHYRLEGDLPPDKVRRAVELARDKYCPVLQSLNAEVTTSFEINGIEYS